MKVHGKPDIESFIDGGNEAKAAPLPAAKKPRLVKVAAEPSKRIKKLFELPEALMVDLEQRCVDERRKQGRRVTQTEIVARALGLYLASKI